MRKPQDRASADAQMQRVTSLRHRDPHSVLGIHPDADGVVVRAFRPDAVSIDVLPDFGGRIPMEHRVNGIFEARLNNRKDLFGYLIEVRYPGNVTFTLRDPYSFAPTLGEMDLHLSGEGKHWRIWERLGAHVTHHHGIAGVSFAVWAPMAEGVSVIGDFNSWDGRLHAMRAMGSSGIWELFVPEISEGARYKFEIRPQGGGPPFHKADPYAFRTEPPPATASVVHDTTRYRWKDDAWLAARRNGDPREKPWSVYEVHLNSWRHIVDDPQAGHSRPMTYREMAPELADYCKRMGFTHVEFLPLAEHPYGGSWGYQVSGYYAPSARFGHPDDLRHLIDHLHQNGIGVIVDWVPGHFPRDAAALGRFDGTALYEHEDPRQGAHPDWGTLVFNFGRNEVRNFLVANALFWLDQYHVDGLRVDAVASMLYLDYSRKQGEWIPNKHGGRENLEAIEFLKELNDQVKARFPGVVVAAEESTAWPKVSHPTSEGGLGFTFKWNMGWMHDTLKYISKDPIYRRHHHNQLTFGLLYAFSEAFILPLSHDEVVHGKGSMLGKMPGDEWQQFANLRALYAWMWAHPGKKLLFMGGEFGQRAEWNHDRSLDWHLLQNPLHDGLRQLVADLNRIYQAEKALHEVDTSFEGFQWIQADALDVNSYAFVRRGKAGAAPVVCVANFSPVPRHRYRVGVPHAGTWQEIFNSDAAAYGGSGVGNHGKVEAFDEAWDGQPACVEISVPPLGALWLKPAAK